MCVRLRAAVMTAWLRTDEKKEVFEALNFARRLLDDVEGDPYYWKWVIIAHHNAMQATMVLAQTGSSQLRVLSERSAKEVTERQDVVRRLADFLELYRRVKDEETMALFVDSKPLIASNDLDSAVCCLHRTLRNKFEHFLPGGWSILVDELPSVLLRCLSAISFLAFESNNIFWSENPTRQEMEAIVTDLNHKLETLQPKDASS